MRGLKGPKYGTKFSRCVVFLGFLMYLWGFKGFNYSQMANEWFLIGCNTFWNIFGTTQNVTKSGPSDPVFITKTLLKSKNNYGDIFGTYYVSYLRIWNSENGRYMYQTFWNFVIWTVENLKIQIWKHDNLKNEIWNSV